MSTKIQAWELIEGKLVEVSTTLQDNNRKEKEDLEAWIKNSPKILGPGILLIGEQVYTKSGPLDFLGIDNNGNLVIVELKRDKLPREVLAQAIDYASDIAGWEVDKLSEICNDFTGLSLEDYLTENFDEIEIDDLMINNNQRLLLVGFSIDESLNRMIEWLSANYDLGINAIILNYTKTAAGSEVISRTVIIPEEVEKQKANKKKFVIDMSNEPGTYNEEELEKHLIEYLSKNLYSAKRIRNYFLPILLEKQKVSREELKSEFVKRNAASDESQAGYFLSLISNQLGHKWKDYLRQVISYGFPNHPWEKDDFQINDEYKELVKRVLEKINNQK